jgi:TP901 family phage tail tape measure protein
MAGIKIAIDLDESQAIKALQALNAQLNKTEDTAKKTGKGFDAFSASFLGNLAAIGATKAFDFVRQQVFESLNTFIAFERGLINVAKTANLTQEETAKLATSMLQLSKNIPASTKELLDIATAAGQLGITGNANLVKFTDTIAKLGRVSNLSGDEAATTLTRILNVTRENIGTIDTFASVIVSLGNNFAATESEIALVTNEVARATAQFGVSASEAAALSATLRSVGVRAEEAGGVLSNTFIKIDEAIRAGGIGLQRLEKITGQTGEEIKKQFGEEPITLFRNFVAGLQKIGASGGNVNRTLADLGIEGVRVSKVLPVLANNVGEFDRALKLASAEVKNATALNTEFEKTITSTASSQQLLENATERARIKIGEKFGAALRDVAPLVTALFDSFSKSDVEKAVDDKSKSIEQLRLELVKYQEFAENIKANPLNLPEFFTGSYDEAARDVELLKNIISELSNDASNNTLANLKTELAGLQDAAKNADPVLLSLYGSPAEIEARKNIILNQIDNLEKQAILNGTANIEEGEKRKTAVIIEQISDRQRLINELAEAQKLVEQDLALQAQIEKDLANEESLLFLQENLGKENALRELARIKNIENETKRIEELKKLKDKAIEQDRASLIDFRKFENLTNKEKVAAQKETIATIATLSQSSNSALFAIGKAASLALAGINVSEGVTKALAAFPPPFNFAAAGAVGAAGAVQIARIASAKAPAGNFADGGIVGGNSFTGDRLQANVNSGEVIFNRRQQENLFNAVDQGNLGGGATITINNPLLLDQGGVDTLINQINDAIEFRNKTLRVG